jgi:two-component system OmpR family response regulator
MSDSASEDCRVTLLVVEDDPAIAEEIRSEFLAKGHGVEVAETVADGLRLARTLTPSILIVDRVLHGEDGLSIIETLRSEGNAAPALVISGLSSVDDRVEGLAAGGDDYLVKPFAVRELAARVQALLRRSADRGATRLRAGAIEMDIVERRVVCDGREIELQPREFKLLEYFVRHAGQIVTRSMLLENVWNFRTVLQTNVIDVHIGNLRRKLDPSDHRRFIVNVRAAGFRLDADR